MPLGIELAAAWVRTLTCQEIAQEIAHGLDFLAAPSRNVPERHRSLRAVFDYSWRMLPDPEQRLLCRLSVFHGRFSRQAAEEIAGATLPLLASLVEKSLLRRAPDGAYSLHELIRQYASAHLEDDPQEAGETGQRHTDYYARWMEEAEFQLKSEQQAATIAEIGARLGNIRAAFQRAAREAWLEPIGRMIPTLHWFYEVQGYFREAVTEFQQAYDALLRASTIGSVTFPEHSSASARSAYALLVDELGWFYCRSGDSESGITFFRQALEILGEMEEPHTLYYIHINWAYIATTLGDWDTATGHGRLAMKQAQHLGSWHQAVGKAVIGGGELFQGKVEAAYAQLHESLALWRVNGDPRGLAFTLNFISSAAQALGHQSEADAALKESAELSASTGDRWGQSTALALLATSHLRQQNLATSETLFRESLTLFEDIGDRVGMATTLSGLGTIYLQRASLAEAARFFEEALTHAKESRNASARAAALLGMAQVAAARGDTATAFEWVTAVLASTGTTGETRVNANRLLAELDIM
jgi:predicted ATPase